MTKEREEAIKLLTQYIDYDAETPDYYEMEKACKVALKVLKQEPCEDCISRADAIANIRILYPDMPVVDIMGARHKWAEKYQQYRDCEKILADLPSIQLTAKENLVVGDCISRKALIEYANNLKDGIGITANDIARFPSIQPKTGHWIATEKDWWKCSECGRKIFSESEVDRKEFQAWCGRCGAKMLPTYSNCDSCKYQNEVDGSNCYECVKGIRNNYKAESEE